MKKPLIHYKVREKNRENLTVNVFLLKKIIK